MRALTFHMRGILVILHEYKSSPQPTHNFIRSALIGLAERGLVEIGVNVVLTRAGRRAALQCAFDAYRAERDSKAQDAYLESHG
jgi:hypothetical protein